MIQPGFTFTDPQGAGWVVRNAQVNMVGTDGSLTATFDARALQTGGVVTTSEMRANVLSDGASTLLVMPNESDQYRYQPLAGTPYSTREGVRNAEVNLAAAKEAHKHAKRKRREQKAEQKRKAATRDLAIWSLEEVACGGGDAERIAAAERLLAL